MPTPRRSIPAGSRKYARTLSPCQPPMHSTPTTTVSAVPPTPFTPLPTGIPDRRYRIDEATGRKVTPSEIERHRAGWCTATCLHCGKCATCGRRMGSYATVIIAVDGACSNNNNDSQKSKNKDNSNVGFPPRAAAGVFFSIASLQNQSFIIGDRYRHTSQVATLAAAIRALNVMVLRVTKQTAATTNNDNNNNRRINGRELTRVVIKADSEYLVKGITEWIFKWQENGYKNCKGDPVANIGLFMTLMDRITRLEAAGVKVFFWLVPPAWNVEADQMARRAIGEMGRR